jgi:hypothetical protein
MAKEHDKITETILSMFFVGFDFIKNNYNFKNSNKKITK